jgi:hypothetical protein
MIYISGLQPRAATTNIPYIRTACLPREEKTDSRSNNLDKKPVIPDTGGTMKRRINHE